MLDEEMFEKFTSTPIYIVCRVLLCDVVLGSALMIWWLFFVVNEKVFGCEFDADMKDLLVGFLFLPCEVKGYGDPVG